MISFILKKIPFILILTMVLPVINAGVITGYVTENATGQPISGMDMNLYDENWNYMPNDASTLAGTYHFYDVPAGNYYVRANPKYPFHYQHEYWQDSPDRENATLVTVPETGEVSGIDFDLIEGWFIEGKVSDVNGGVIANIDINVYDLEWNKMDVDTETDEYGRYQIGGLPGGDYYVMANPVYMQPYVDQYFDGSAGPIHATPVTLAPPDDLIGVTFTLVDGSYIRGRVTDKDTGKPLGNYAVKAYNASGSKMRLEDRTDSDGYFTLGAYAMGDYYVKVDPSYPSGYMDTWYPGVFQMSSATTVTVTGPKPTYNVDIPAPAGSYIRGVVTGNTSSGIEDIKIKFYDRDWEYMELATTRTKADGSYLSGALKPGRYYVKAVPIYPQPWIDEFYPDAIEDHDADTVSVALAGETTGIDLELAPGGYLLGNISYQNSGSPLYDVDLDLYDENWNWVDYSDHTNSHGNFLIGALPAGNYYLRADPSLEHGYIPQFWDLAFMTSDASIIQLDLSGNQENLNFQLDDGGFLSGSIKDSDSDLPVDSIKVEIMTMNGDVLPIHTVRSDEDGRYIAYGIPTGEYYAVAAMETDDGFETQYYNGVASIDTAQSVAVVQGETLSDIDFSLTAIPEPTPTPAVSLGVDLELSGELFKKGDIFYLNARVSNPGQQMENIPMFVILDVYGTMFFWPGWIPGDQGIDYKLIQLKTGIQVIPVLPAFEWPDVDGNASDLMFYAGLTRADFSRLLGDMDMVTFGYSE